MKRVVFIHLLVMDAIINDLLSGKMYTLTVLNHEMAERVLLPIVKTLLSKRKPVSLMTCLMRHHFVKISIESQMRTDYYTRLGDFVTLTRLENQEIERNTPYLFLNQINSGSIVISDRTDVSATILIIIDPHCRQTPLWQVVVTPEPCKTHFICLPFSKTLSTLLDNAKTVEKKILLRHLRNGSLSGVDLELQLSKVSSLLEKQAIAASYRRSTCFSNNVLEPRWKWLADHMNRQNTDKKTVILTSEPLVADFLSYIKKKVVHINLIDLSLPINDFTTLLISQAYEGSDSLVGNVPLWLKVNGIVFDKLILLNAAWQQWPLPKSILNKEIFRIVCVGERSISRVRNDGSLSPSLIPLQDSNDLLELDLFTSRN